MTDKEFEIWETSHQLLILTTAMNLALDSMSKIGGSDCIGCEIDRDFCEYCGYKDKMNEYFLNKAKEILKNDN